MSYKNTFFLGLKNTFLNYFLKNSEGASWRHNLIQLKPCSLSIIDQSTLNFFTVCRIDSHQPDTDTDWSHWKKYVFKNKNWAYYDLKDFTSDFKKTFFDGKYCRGKKNLLFYWVICRKKDMGQKIPRKQTYINEPSLQH